MKHSVLTIILMVMAGHLMAKDISGTVIEKDGTPLIGVNLFWKGTTEGQVTDINGKFKIPTNHQSHILVVKYLGYNEKEVKANNAQLPLIITLEKDALSLNEVEVSVRAPGAHISRLEPLNATTITGEELCKAACCNLAESFVTNPSVDVSYSDAATGAKQIRLLGLSGLYVQMLTENMPSFRGLASTYGLEYIPGPWMESIQVSKGSASVINGYEAISGQINVEYKKPQNSDYLNLNLFGSDAGRRELNVSSATNLSDNLSTMILAHVKDDNQLIDNNNDGFLDMPMVRQYNFINRWNHKKENYIGQYGLKVIHEKRRSGQKAYYEDDQSAYGINLKTKRYEFFTKQGFIFDHVTSESLGIQASGSYHQMNAFYGNKKYDAEQRNIYVNAIYQNWINHNSAHQYSLGTSLMYDDYQETLNNTPYDREEIVNGAFFQYTYNRDDKFIMLAGLRGDYHNEYGFFATPRLHLKYNVTEHIHLRANTGLGYRSANVLAENSFLLASSREIIIDHNLNQEMALNSGLSATIYIPIGGKEATLSSDYYYTNFIKQVIANVDSDPHQVHFENLDGQSYSHALQTQLSYEILRGLTLTTAYRQSIVKMTIDGKLRDKALTNKYKGLITASYQTPLKKWQFDFTTQFNGGGRMPDGTTWETNYGSYTIMNTQITKYFRHWSIYVGSENLSNYKMNHPIIDAENPWGTNFDASMVWGPVHGRKIYAGLRWNIDRE